MTYLKFVPQPKFSITHRRLNFRFVVFALVTLTCSNGAALGAGFHVWTADAMERVERNDLPTKHVVQLNAARGEYESFQLVIRAEQADFTSVRVAVSDFVGPGRIRASEISLYREHYVEVPAASRTQSGSNASLGSSWYPDALIPIKNAKNDLFTRPFAVRARLNQPIWVDVLIPRDARPGSYSAIVRVLSDQGEKSIAVFLDVWDFELPLQSSLKTCFLIWEAKHQQAYEELLRNKISPCQVGVEQDLRLLIDKFGLNGQNVGKWSGADARSNGMRQAPPSREWLELQRRYPKDFQDKLFNYTADEIGGKTQLYERMKEWARSIHAESSIKNLVVMPPDPRLYDDGTGRPAVDIWVVLPKQSSDEDRRAIAKGMEIWSYNALVQDGYSPKWMLDSRPIEYRIQPGWLNVVYGYTGLLYWRADLWTKDVWTAPRLEIAGKSFPGEGLLIYPGTHAGQQGVVPSMRLKYLREGIEDFEYYAILKRLGREAEALEIVRQVAADWNRWTKSNNALYVARKKLGDLAQKSVADNRR